MKIISHRGNYNGIIPDKENKPSYIDTTLSMGYDVEVDIRYINGHFYLGHDTPDYLVTENWLNLRKDKLWLHCKDLYSAIKLSELSSENDYFNYFCHSNDPYVLTSTKHIWVHDLSMNLNDKTIIPLLDKNDIIGYNNNVVYGICTDYINILKDKIKNN